MLTDAVCANVSLLSLMSLTITVCKVHVHRISTSIQVCATILEL